MAEKWLVERLTKSKQGSPQWVALAEALEEYWDTHFFNELQTFEDSKNIFTASEDHLNQKIAEFGDYFDTALPLDTSGKRLSISWQRANIHEKDTIVPFVNSLSVNFAGLGVTWEPLYSNKSQPYARDNLFTEQEVQIKKWDLNDFWMTSRGKIAVDLTHLHKLGMAKETFIAIAKREIERLRPAHIVYDGELFILTINFDYAPLSYHVERQTVGEKGGSMVYRLTASFDDRPLTCLGWMIVLCMWNIEEVPQRARRILSLVVCRGLSTCLSIWVVVVCHWPERKATSSTHCRKYPVLNAISLFNTPICHCQAPH